MLDCLIIFALVLDPTFIVGLYVVPARLQLVADRPHELCFNCFVQYVESALAQLHHIIIFKEV